MMPNLWTDLRQDIRHAARMMRTQPGFAAAAVLTLALGIGATTAIFSVVNGVLINPLPYPDSDRLVLISTRSAASDLPYFSDAIFLDLRGEQPDVSGLRRRGIRKGRRRPITGRGEPEEVRTLTVSRGVLTTLGVQPEIGRWFSNADDAPGAPDAVMLTNALLASEVWRRPCRPRADAHHQRPTAPDHRRHAGGASASAASPTSSCRCGSTARSRYLRSASRGWPG